jgi:lysozyme
MKVFAALGLIATGGLVVGCTSPSENDLERSTSESLVAPMDTTDPSDPLPPTDPTESAVPAPTCAPSFATGAVPTKHRAMLDTIAYTEGTAGSCGQDGYNTGYAYHCFTSCTRHPNIAWTAGSWTSTAAGRYQFLYRTWTALGLGPFSPKNQDVGAMKLISNRGVTLPTTRALTATEFSNAMKKLSYEWASLPYSPYGQPTVTLARARAKYCSFAGC